MFQQLNSMLINLPDASTGDNGETTYGVLARTGGSTPEYSWTTPSFTLGVPFAKTYNVTTSPVLVYTDEVSKRAAGTCTINWDPNQSIEVGTYYLKCKLRIYVESIDLLLANANTVEHEGDNEGDLQRIITNQYNIQVALGGNTVLSEGVYDSLNSMQTFESTSIVNITSTTPVITVTTNMGVPFGVQLFNYEIADDTTEFKVNCLQFVLMKLSIANT